MAADIFPFFELPAELRHQIYDYVVLTDRRGRRPFKVQEDFMYKPLDPSPTLWKLPPSSS